MPNVNSIIQDFSQNFKTF